MARNPSLAKQLFGYAILEHRQRQSKRQGGRKKKEAEKGKAGKERHYQKESRPTQCLMHQWHLNESSKSVAKNHRFW